MKLTSCKNVKVLRLKFTGAGVTDYALVLSNCQNMTVERFSHVMHIVSEVEGQLDPKLGPWDVVRATFPAGTLTGAPKVRAMQIIRELEGRPRGAYGARKPPGA